MSRDDDPHGGAAQDCAVDKRAQDCAADERAREGARLRGGTGNRWNAEREERFLRELTLTGDMDHAAVAAGMTRRGAHKRRKTVPAFAARWAQAIEAWTKLVLARDARVTVEGGSVGVEDMRCPGPANDAQRESARTNARVNRRWNAARDAVFFAELAETANVTHSVLRAGMTTLSAYHRRSRDPAFAAKWIVALTEGYARLEMRMLDQSLNGFERTETVRGPDGAVKQVKTVHSFPHGVAMRLLQSHREAAERYRTMAAMRDEPDPELIARIRAEMARVRARLTGAFGTDGDGAEAMRRLGHAVPEVADGGESGGGESGAGEVGGGEGDG